MNKLLLTIACIIALTSTMGAWNYNFFITVPAYKFFTILFILVYCAYLALLRNKTVIFEKRVSQFFLFNLILFLIKIISAIGLFQYIYSSQTLVGPVFDQFFKGILNDLINLFFIFLLALFFINLSYRYRTIIIDTFIFSILASCIYQYTSLLLLEKYNIDLDRTIWPAISYNISPDYTFLSNFRIGNYFLSTYRSGGFAINPNSFASQLICVIPYILFSIASRNWRFIPLIFITFLSLVLTMSRSGLIGVSIATLLFIFIEYRTIISKYKFLTFIFSSASIIIIYYFWQDLLLFYMRGSETIFDMGSRKLLNELGVDTISKFPFGVGHNNSNNVILQYHEFVETTGADFHNFWMIKFVELGFLGFSSTILFYLFILYCAKEKNNIFSKSLFCSICGLAASGLFNNFMANFSSQFYISIFFFAAMLDHKIESRKNATYEEVIPKTLLIRN